MQREVGVTARDFALLVLLTSLTLLGYQFGIGNQVEQFPIIGRLGDPEFLKGDFYVDSAAGFGPRYYYSLFVSFLAGLVPLPAAVLVLSCVAGLAVAAVTFVACRRHFGAAALGAAVASAFALLNNGFSLGLAGYLRFESFQPASLAIPLSLFGFFLLVEGRRFFAASMFAAGAVFHPLVGVETAVIAFAACAVAEVAARRPMSAVLKYLPSGLFFSALIFLIWAAPGLVAKSDPISDAAFFAILPEFRSPHHYLATTFPLWSYASAAVFTAAVAFLGWRTAKARPREFANSAYLAAAFIIIALCAASVFFVDVMHDRVFSTAQVFRNLLLLKWIGFLYFGAIAGRWTETRRPLHFVAPLAALVATGDTQPYVMAAALIAVEAFESRPRNPMLEYAVAALLAAASLGLAWKFGTVETASRALVATVILATFFAASLSTTIAAGAAAALVATLLAVGLVNRDREVVSHTIFEPTFSWRDLKGPKAEVARWARANAPREGLWLTPPGFENFRLIAERPVIVDFTSIPFDGGAMLEWRRRIEVLYGPVSGTGFAALRSSEKNYRALSEEALIDRSREFGAAYAVLYASTPWSGVVLYENERYKAVKLGL